ncbi:MAG TPA: fused MFS/spermidine synthase [Blastocatellia bacterium]|nr:fused MFS/spermidine synthase [Blastocatellia bacterium]
MASRTQASTDRRATLAIMLCFFASGMSGLVYQVVWVRELVLVFGATTFAVSTVLTAFMGGLALGSYYFGRSSWKITRPLRAYGLLEIGIGIWGFAVPFILAILPNIYRTLWQWELSFFALSIIRFLLAALVLIVPTALMGATLPVLSSHFARDFTRIGLRVGTLYSLNTFGAVVGALITGFVLIPLLGMRATTATAASINLLLGIVALYVSRYVSRAFTHASPAAADFGAAEPGRAIRPDHRRARSKAPREGWSSDAHPGRGAVITVLVGFALSGFVALSYEVIWSRVLALIIGSSVYAFSIMLTTFLIGLALGASAAARLADRIRNPIVAFALIEAGVGLTSLAGTYLFNDLPYVFVQLYRLVESSGWGVLLFVRFVVASLVMLGPTLLLGALFPVVVRIISSRAGNRTTGQMVGEAYAANTVGAIAGSFASGFVLIPWLGLLDSLKVSAAVNFAVAGALFFVTGPPVRRWVGTAAAGALVVGVALFHPPWDSDVMSSAVYRYAPSLSQMSRQQMSEYLKRGQGETVFYKEGITSTVAVQKQGDDLVLKVNGKPEASTAGDMPTQILIGSLPLLVREHTDDVLVIGLGSGITLGSVLRFPIKRATCVELEPAVVEASYHFGDANNRPLADPRLKLIANDGRNYLFTTNEKFDVIVSEPSNPWVTGVANLFTLEYFKRGAERLRDDGIFSQWLQIYEMSPEDVRALIATFRAAFPYVYVVRGAEGDLMLLGAKQERRLDLSVISAHLTEASLAADLKRINTASAADLISRFYLGPSEVDGLSKGAPLNTDDNALIEFSAPRRVGTAEETVERNLKLLLAHAASPVPYTDGLPKWDSSRADFLLDVALGALKRNDTGRAEQFVAYSRDTLETARGFSISGELRLARGDETGALEDWRQALQIDASHFYTLVNLGKLYLTKQDLPRATPYLDLALQAEPASARAHHLRGLAYQAAGDHARAALEYRKALPDLQYTRSIWTFYLNFGTALDAEGLYEEAREMLEEYARLVPRDPDGHYLLGAVLEKLAERTVDEALTRRAIEELKLGLGIKPGHATSHYYLSKAYRRLGLFDQADAEFEMYERLSP